MALRLASYALRNKQLLCKQVTPWVLSLKRTTSNDFCRTMIGKREIVGYGWNGCPNYYDRPDFPFPPIRFREATVEICALRQKELCDWKKLTMDEKKQLYRYSFCQTFAEFEKFTPDWKLCLAVALWCVAGAILIQLSYYVFLYGPLPETFDEDRRSAQLKRILAMENAPIHGIASKWDYENKKWK